MNSQATGGDNVSENEDKSQPVKENCVSIEVDINASQSNEVFHAVQSAVSSENSSDIFRQPLEGELKTDPVRDNQSSENLFSTIVVEERDNISSLMNVETAAVEANDGLSGTEKNHGTNDSITSTEDNDLNISIKQKNLKSIQIATLNLSSDGTVGISGDVLRDTLASPSEDLIPVSEVKNRQQILMTNHSDDYMQFNGSSIEDCLKNGTEVSHVAESALHDDSVTEFDSVEDKVIHQTNSVLVKSTSTQQDLSSKFSNFVGNLHGQIQSTETKPSSEAAGGLKNSVFKVFRDVAKSVNTDRVNENLNEVYRNVLKKSSEKFSGPGFINKFNVEVLSNASKNSSSESLSSISSQAMLNKPSPQIEHTNYDSSNHCVSGQSNNSSFPQPISINLKKDFYFDSDENEQTVPNRKLSVTSDSNISKNFSSSITKATSLQELPGKLSPAVLKRSINDDKHSSNIEINSPIKSNSSQPQCSNSSNCKGESSEEVLSLSSEEEPILSVQQLRSELEMHGDQELSDITSMERCQLIGLDKDHLVEIFIKLKESWLSVKNSNSRYELVGIKNLSFSV